MSRKQFCVIGLGNFGFQVVKTLYREGYDVTAIDMRKDRVQAIKDEATTAILGDAGNKDFLVAQGLAEMDAVVVATGERSHLSTLITLFLKELKVPRIIVKALSDDHGRILERVGATDVIFPEKDTAIRVAHSIVSPNILEFIPLAEDYSITETEPPKSFLGKTLQELDLRKQYNVTVIAIKDILTEEFTPTPPPSYRLKDSDVLIFIGRSDDIEQALNKQS